MSPLKKRCYLGADAVRGGWKARLWNGGIVAAILVVAAGAAVKLLL